MKELSPKLQALCTARFNLIVAWKELASQAVAAGDYDTLCELSDLLRSERECLRAKLGTVEANVNAACYAARRG